jgi:hypothetical protein
MKTIALAALLAFPACATQRVSAPIEVVVTAQGPFAEADAALLRQITNDAIRRSVHDGPARSISIAMDYQRGDVSNIPLRSTPSGIRLAGAMYTIRDAAGHVLESQWVPMTGAESNLGVMHDTARWIAVRVAHLRFAYDCSPVLERVL